MPVVYVVAGSLVLSAFAGAGLAEAGERATQAVRFVRGSLSNSPVYGPYNSVRIALGYYAEEGLEVIFSAAAGSLATIQQLAAGHGDVGIPSPKAVLIARQPDKNIRLIHVYNFNRQNIYTVAVPEAGPLRAFGLEPGQGGQALATVSGGRVDALALWELEYAAMEVAGLKLRRLVNPAFGKFFSNGIVAREEYLQANPDGPGRPGPCRG